jgi:hypothetical protein
LVLSEKISTDTGKVRDEINFNDWSSEHFFAEDKTEEFVYLKEKYRVGHEKVARLPFCTCSWLLY